MRIINNLFNLMAELKDTPRQGWVDHSVSHPETVWQHSRDLRSLSLALAPIYAPQLNAEHCARIGSCHDTTEGIVVDITPRMGIDKEKKHELEMMAIDHIGSFGRGGARVRDLWLEFELVKSHEAAFVQKLDRLHIGYKALEYEKQNRCPYSLQEFWNYVEKAVSGHPLLEVFEKLHAQRPKDASEKPALPAANSRTATFEELKHSALIKMGKRPTLNS